MGSGDNDDTIRDGDGDAITLPVAPPPASDIDLAVPWGLDAYQPMRLLGRGGMGEVVLAYDKRIGRDVAVKRMLNAAPSPEESARFLREARVQARLEHPAIVPVHEVGRDADGRLYFAMKRLAGISLDQLVQAPKPPPAQRLLRAFAEVCLAIEFAHSRSVVHRDLKPSNIMLGDFGEVYVLDWGIARFVADPDATPAVDDPAATQTGTMVGTPGYMAPEQVRGQDTDRPADVYALGAILFEILTGEPLHPRKPLDALHSTLDGVDTSPAARHAERAIAPELDAICIEALATDPAMRPSARVVGERIQHYLDGDRDTERRTELAREQLATAHAALATDPVAAMRAAGRALALDPKSSDAARVVTMLMLEPAREHPPELVARFAELDAQIARSGSKTIAKTFGAYVLFLPIALFGRDFNWPLLVGLYAFAAAATTVVIDRVFAFWSRHLVAVLALNCIYLAVLSRLFGTFILAPGLIASATLTAISYPGYTDHKWKVFAGLVLAFVAPFALEAAGAIPTSWAISGDAIVSYPQLIHLDPTPMLVLLVGTNAAMILAMGLVAHSLAASRRDAIRRVEAQAWRLRQLLPT